MNFICFNTPRFSIVTTKDIINVFYISLTPSLFHHPRFKLFIQQNLNDLLTILSSIIDLLHPAPESPYLSCIVSFEGWLCIAFTYTIFFTHFRYPPLIPLYPCTISALQIRTLVLYILPFRVSNHIDNNFLSINIPPTILPPTHIQCISNCFTLQPLSAKHTWHAAYQQDSHTNMFINHFTINAQLDQFTILNLPAVYRASLSRNKLGLFEGRLVYYEQFYFSNKNICCIIFPLFLRHKISNLMHATPVAGHTGEYKFIVLIYVSFGHEYVPILKNECNYFPYCTLTYHSRRRGQELMSSCLVSSPFTILCVDL